MKVLINAISAKQGGILTYTRNLMRSMVERRINAVFAVPKSFEPINGCRTIPVAASEYKGPARLIWEQTVWRAMVAREKPDVLFSSANFSLLYSKVPQLLLVREGGLFDPFYLANFSLEQGFKISVMRRIRRRLMLASARHADLVMTPTEELRRNILGWAPSISGHAVCNWYGTLEHTFSQSENFRTWREDGTLRVLYVSIYYAHKNPGTLVRAVSRIKRSGVDVHARITMNLEEIMGTPGGKQDAIIMQSGVDQGLVSTGRHPYERLPELYRNSDVFVFPAVCETFGHPMVEALASGLPVVVAEHPVNREICGDAALYFSPFSSEELAARLKELEDNPRLREELSRKGRQRVLSCFTWDGHMDRLSALLEKVAMNGPRT